MKKYTIQSLLLFVCSTLLLTSCLKDDDDYTPIPAAGFTMINAYSDASAIRYAADDRTLQNPYYPLEYKNYGMVALYTGSRKITVYSSTTVLTDTTFTAKDSTYYSSFVYGTATAPKHIITTDRVLEGLDNTKSAVRFLQLANLNGTASLQIGEQAPESFKDRSLETQLSADAHQTFIPVNSGKFKIVAKNSAGDVIATREDIQLKEKYYYSFILIGKPNDTERPLYIGVVAQAAN